MRKLLLKIAFGILSMLLLFTVGVKAQAVIFVNVGNTGGTYNGTTWATAYNDLQTAINNAVSGDSIFVEQGTYFAPTNGFVLKEGLKVYGGFAGTETSFSQRNLAAGYTTYLTGNGSTRVVNDSSNALTTATVLDGFTIEFGKAINGGGMYNKLSSPTLSNLIFSSNTASSQGGGIYNINSSPILDHVVFTNNSGYYGAGIFNWSSSSPTLTDVYFYNNTANQNGGALYNYTFDAPVLVNVVFNQNSSTNSNGGAIANYDATPKLTNVTFYKNSALYGGAIDNENGSQTSVSNSIFYSNSASMSSVAGDIYNATSSDGATVTYSYIGESPYNTGTGNNYVYPLSFVSVYSPAGADGMYMTPDDGLEVQCGASTINSGRNDSVPAGVTTDIAGTQRIEVGTVDMGAYENASATSSTISVASCNTYTSPSGKYTWTTSGTYHDTIANAAGCDSMMTINLTIGTNASSSMQAFASCDSVVSPSGKYTWKTNGTYHDTIPNAVGCDSDITAYVTINSIADQAASVTPTNSACSANAVVSLASSQSGYSYYLRDNSNNSIIQGPVSGTGSALSFSVDAISTSKTYNVLATTQDQKALSFDGVNDVVSFGNNTLGITGSGARTIEFWMKTSSTAQMTLVHLGNGSSNQRFGVRVQAGTLFIDISGTRQYFNTTLDDGQWHHVAISYPAGAPLNGISAYVDGQSVSQGTSSSFVPNTQSGEVTIGARGNTYAFFYQGEIDEVRIWNIALTQSQIVANMRTSLIGNESNLVAYWKIEKGSGTTVKDYTSGGHNGTMINMTPSTEWVAGYPFCGNCSHQMSVTPSVTITQPSSTNTLTACDSLVSPSGKYTWKTSGTYHDTIPSAEGCDSLMTFNLTINHSTGSSLTQTTCGADTVNGTVYGSSGTYTQQFTNAAGCDSTLTLHLTINQPSSASLTQTTCGADTVNGTVYTSSGTYTQHLTNAVGCDSALTLNLTINQPTSSTQSFTVCDSVVSPSGKYTWTTSGVYNDTIPNAVGCDSVLTINLTVNTVPTSSTQTMTVAGSYTSPSGKLWTSSGTYMDTIPNADGCDSVMTINLTIVPRIYVDSSNVNGTHDGLSWATAYNKFENAVNVSVPSDTIFVAKGTYQPAIKMSFTMHDSVGIYGGFAGTESSLSQRNLAAGYRSILKGNDTTVIDNSTNNLTRAALLDGFFVVDGVSTQSGGMENNNSSPTINHVVFANDSCVGKGDEGGAMQNSYSSPMIMNTVFINNSSAGSDGGGAIQNLNASPVFINVAFYSNHSDNGFGGGIENISSNPVFTNVTFAYNTAMDGGAMDNYQNTTDTISNTIFWGNTNTGGHPDMFDEDGLSKIAYSYTQTSFTGAGNIQGTANPFVDSVNVAGADGVYMTPDDGLQLVCGSVAINAGRNDSVPAGVTKDIAGETRIQEGTVDMGAYENSSMTTSSINVTACDSDVSPSGNYTWTTSGTYMDTIPNALGCDSIITVNLTIHNATTSSQTLTACDSYTSPSGKTWTTSGTYMDTIPNMAGCDSVMTINLTIHHSTSSTLPVTACDSYTSPSGNYTWTASGTYNDTIPNATGCDSVMTINLTIHHSTTSQQTTTVCDSMVWHGVTYTASGAYNDTIPNAIGCDSVMTLNLTVNHSYANTQTVASCHSYTWEGVTYTTSGTYYDSLSTVNGCDSILTLNLTIGTNATSSTQNITACDSYTSPSGNYTWTTNGTYMDTIPNAGGCDSVMTINLTIDHSTSSSQTTTVCDSTIWHGVTYTSSGTYNDTIPNAVGCDSVMTLNLTVNHSYANTQTVTACDSMMWNGTIYNASGTYVDTLSTMNGCDSILTLNLTIHHSTSSMQTVTACDSYMSPSGKTWTTSGTYMDTIPNSGGCDSVMTINLTIDHSTTSTLTGAFCDSVVSPSGNYTYTASGTYMDTIPNAVGCDSVMTLNVTIHHSYANTQTVAACNSYLWEGTTYTTSGTYVDSLSTVNGCDSILTLNLTVGTNATSSTQTVTACDSYTSPSGNYTWTTNGSYMDTIPNAGGCDSVMTINLTIDHSTSSSQTATVCDSMIWHGVTYTTSGTYNDTIPNAVGCDSVMTLNLTVNHSSSTTQTASACSNYTWNGMTYTSSGMYTDTLASSGGCDSIVTLNLTIGSITASAAQVGDSLVAGPAGGTYQWIDCNNGNAAISGATGQSYTPSSNGSYAVIVNEGSCTDTSTCATYVMTGINNTATNNYLKVYPNPSMGSITISSDLTGIYYLVNELGQRIEVIELTNANHKTVSVSGLANGIYTLVGHHGNRMISKRIVVTR